MNIWLAALIIFLFNIPFGYWRANVKRFSFQWALAVHIPVPFVIALRIFGKLGFRFITYPILVGSFFFGQITGQYLYKLMKTKIKFPISSCLLMDLVRINNKS